SGKDCPGAKVKAMRFAPSPCSSRFTAGRPRGWSGCGGAASANTSSAVAVPASPSPIVRPPSAAAPSSGAPPARHSVLTASSPLRVVASHDVCFELVIAPVVDRCPDLGDELHDEVLVVEGAERGEQHLLRLPQVMQVRPRIVRARVARALRVDRPPVPPVAGSGDVVAAVARVD